MKDSLVFKEIKDNRGALVAIEAEKDIPFGIKRVYYIYGTAEKVRRGYHAHHELQQLAVCVKGACTFLLDDGNKKEILRLETPNKGVLINKMVWHEMYDFTDDCVLMVLASDHYKEDDYIRDYDEFVDLLG
ncbi:FdtA/QdtA family cupin domain-containing protein [Kistimonas scapharcae]|uniref:FdtA/QdtA family cupin domain-containing protein n=1 Tax=Kistimonas scapharcae TaxID=1036133 RepID=A0ABP8V8Z3_9GAMM